MYSGVAFVKEQAPAKREAWRVASDKAFPRTAVLPGKVDVKLRERAVGDVDSSMTSDRAAVL